MGKGRLALLVIMALAIIESPWALAGHPTARKGGSLPVAAGVYMLERGPSGPYYSKLHRPPPNDWSLDPGPQATERAVPPRRVAAAGSTVTLFVTGLPADEMRSLHITVCGPTQAATQRFRPYAMPATVTYLASGLRLVGNERLKAGWAYVVATSRRHYDLYCR